MLYPFHVILSVMVGPKKSQGRELEYTAKDLASVEKTKSTHIARDENPKANSKIKLHSSNLGKTSNFW